MLVSLLFRKLCLTYLWQSLRVKEVRDLRPVSQVKVLKSVRRRNEWARFSCLFIEEVNP